MGKEYSFSSHKSLLGVLVFIMVWTWMAARLCAAPRSESEARRVAETFLKAQSSSVKRSFSGGVRLVATSDDLGQVAKRNADGSVPAWYVYNQGAEAFVLVSGDDRMPDILGYSTDGAFVVEGMPSNLRVWLENYTAWADALQAGRVVETKLVQPVSAGFPESVAPLLGDISYDQIAPYNNFCPELDGQRCAVGCMATAMATILSYWKYPERGTGSHSYTSSTYGFPCSFDFGSTVFDWENILPTYAKVEYTDEQAEAIATLMYACGVAVNMDYGPESSAFSSEMLSGIVKYLGFNPYARIPLRSMFSTQEWMELVFSELSARRPILYCGTDKNSGGHAFVVDGYDRNGMVHVDWGWSNASNGYFDIVTLQPYELGVGSGSGTGYAFGQLMSMGLVPATIDSVPRSLFGALEDFRIEGDSVFIYSVLNCGGTFNGNLAIVAERDSVQTVLSELLQLEDMLPNCRIGNIRLGVSYPTEAGAYHVYLGSRADGESSWTRARSNGFNTEEYILTVHENGTRELVAAESRLPLPEVGQLSCTGNIYANCYAQFNVPISNSQATDNLVGFLCFYIQTEDGQELFLKKSAVSLAPGQDGIQTIEVLMPDVEGTCEISAYWVTSDFDYQYIPVGPSYTVEVRRGVVTTEVNFRSACLDRDVYMQGDTVTCTWQMDLDELDGDVFSQWLLVGVWPKEFGEVLRKADFLVTVEQGVPGEFSHKVVADLEPGEYRYLIVYGSSLLWTGYFSVEETDAVASSQVTGEKPEWCPSNGGTELCFRYAKDVERVDVYDVAGRLVRTAEVVREGSGTYVVDGSGLSCGQYVLRISAADGSTAALKFVR